MMITAAAAATLARTADTWETLFGQFARADEGTVAERLAWEAMDAWCRATGEHNPIARPEESRSVYVETAEGHTYLLGGEANSDRGAIAVVVEDGEFSPVGLRFGGARASIREVDGWDWAWVVKVL
jgi:hypothetical protein